MCRRRFGSAFEKPAEEDRDQVLAQLDQLSPAQRRERIQFLATKIVKDRGIELLPGERVEDAALRAIKANLRGNSADQISSRNRARGEKRNESNSENHCGHTGS